MQLIKCTNCNYVTVIKCYCGNVFISLQSKPITPTSAPDEGDIFSEEGSYIRTDVHHATNGLHSDEELDLFTGISHHSIAAPLLKMSNKYLISHAGQMATELLSGEHIMNYISVFKIAWQ